MDNDPNLSTASAPVPTPPVPPQASAPAAVPVAPIVPMICQQCHQPVRPEWYFCPNCGKKLTDPALSTSMSSQLWLYAFSLVLPFIGYLAITYWQGIKYARSDDPKAQEIGWIAIGLLALSSIYVLWQVTAWINGAVQSATSTAGLSGLL
jgi:hypothetical protein